MEENYFDINRQNWDKRVSIHVKSEFYDVEGFKRKQDSLNRIEIEELGEVKEKDMLHLQCHFGLDSLSWAKRGANVTGIDFSENAIAVAIDLNKELKLDARFVCSNVYDLPDHLEGQFDIIFTSYGVIGWLPDLVRWAKVIDHFLKPGGQFYMVEFHPVLWMFDDDFTRFTYPYFNEGVIDIDQETTYTDGKEKLSMKEYSWNHSLSEVINALTGQGLYLRFLNEHKYSPYDCFNNTIRDDEGHYYISGLKGIVPMVYSLLAQKPEA